MRTVRRILLIIVVLLSAVILLLRSFGHRELMAYITELQAKGERVTFPELAAALSHHTNDSFVRLTNLMLKLGPPPTDVRNLRMGQFDESRNTRPLCSLDFPWMVTTNGPTNGSWKDLSKRISEAAPLLREASQLLRHPSPNAGSWTNYLGRVVALPEKQKSASWLACAALANLRDDRRDDAVIQIQALAGLANTHEEEFVIATQILRAAISDTGCELVWEALQSKGWSEQQLMAMQRSWEVLDFLAALERGMEGERCLPLEALVFARDRARGKDSEFKNAQHKIVYRVYLTTILANDALYGLRHLHTEVGFARQLRQEQSLKKVLESVQNENDKLEDKSRSMARIFFLISLTTIPNWKGAFSRAAEAEIHRRLAITAIALRRYELKYGRLPVDLGSLAPEFLSKVPRDCMDGQPLRYRANRDGSAILYSVGKDGKDDGGNPASKKAESVASLLDGRDIVWPLPAWKSESRNLQSAAQEGD